MKTNIQFLPDDADIPGLEQRVSGAKVRRVLDVSRSSFDRLVATGALGKPIVHHNGKNATRYYKLAVVKAYIEARDRDNEKQQFEICAKAAAVLRRVRR